MIESAPHNTTHSCPSIVAGTGVAYPHASLPFSQISSPVCLLNAAPAEPTLRINRSSTTSGDPEKCHVGSVKPNFRFSCCSQSTLPVSAWRQSRSPIFESV